MMSEAAPSLAQIMRRIRAIIQGGNATDRNATDHSAVGSLQLPTHRRALTVRQILQRIRAIICGDQRIQ